MERKALRRYNKYENKASDKCESKSECVRGLVTDLKKQIKLKYTE